MKLRYAETALMEVNEIFAYYPISNCSLASRA